MRVSKLMVGVTLAVTALLTGCGTPKAAPAPQAKAATQDTTTEETTTTTVAPTTTSAPAPTTTTTVKPTTTSKKPTTSKPTTPKAPVTPAAGTPCNSTARACVDLSANQAWLLKDGKVVYGPVPITSGRPGYRTPPGTYHVQYKDIDHKSKEFNDAPMPYSVFFYSGMAFHTGSLQVQSHGCIHLSNAAAQTFFNTLAVGNVVQVVA